VNEKLLKVSFEYEIVAESVAEVMKLVEGLRAEVLKKEVGNSVT
jgi:hypothetical protein